MTKRKIKVGLDITKENKKPEKLQFKERPILIWIK